MLNYDVPLDGIRDDDMTKIFQNLILALDYETALAQLDAGLSDDEKNLVKVEIVFFYNESGLFDRALDVMRNIPAMADQQPNSPAGVRNILEQYNSEYYRFLNLRYFPSATHVAGGTFNFGPFRREEQVFVTLSNFEISVTPITVWQYAVYSQPSSRQMREKMPGQGLGGNNPMVNLNWYETLEYANWLSLRQGHRPVYQIEKDRPGQNNLNKTDKVNWSVHMDPTANGYRLPTEAEWEYAAGGGRQGHGFRYAGSDQIDDVAWYSENTDVIQAVAQKRPNELGIYDMSGLVWEWCWDWDGAYLPGHWKDPQGPLQGTYRIARGGSFRDVDDQCLVTNRGSGNSHVSDDSYGMRLVRMPG